MREIKESPLYFKDLVYKRMANKLKREYKKIVRRAFDAYIELARNLDSTLEAYHFLFDIPIQHWPTTVRRYLLKESL